jgi:NAD(P)-dependent dehydrogenase (short-subunit alcohol dehydrogenase family)
MSTFNFLITGCSSGLGAHTAVAALKAGHFVLSTARNVPVAQRTYPSIEQLGGKWLALDVTFPDTQSIVSRAVQEHNINVVINNAGYALRGVLEDLSMDDLRAQFETNIFGALAVTKGCIPYFRSNRNGTIVNISSTSGMSGNAGYAGYAASKFALEGASESIAAELAPFGIRVLIVEPGGLRTNFQAAVHARNEVSEPYKGTVADQLAERMRGVHGKQPGDPEKAGQAIVEAVTKTGRGADTEGLLRLPLGKDAVIRAQTKISSFSKNVEKVKHISEWAVFDE